jgi:cytosine/adenosine deaminase-related metal-dependent hydrolase
VTGAVRLVRARHVLTCGPAGEVRDGAVAVTGSRITDVGPFGALRVRHPAAPVVGDGSGILVPGFVSCHGHFSEALVSGIGETHTLWEWFVHVTGPLEPCVTREMALVGTMLRGAEMALSGVTTVADMMCIAPGREPVTPGVVEGLDRLGLRGDVSYGAADDPNPRPLDRVVAEHEALAAAAEASRRSRFRVGLATVPTSSDELIAATAALVARTGRFHVHLNEVREEVTQSRIQRGMTSIAYAQRAGLLDAQVLAAHCVWLDDADVRLLREHDVAVAHNPVSNMLLASGVCPVPRLLREGVTVGLGLDGPASNDSQDMLETMKATALLQKVHHLQATALTARDVLHMATLGGARALGLADEIGSLEPGKAADLVLFPEHSPSLANIHDPYQKLVYCASVRDVAQVWVDGHPVVADGRVLGVDIAELLPHARELAVRLATDAGLDSALAARPAPADPPA